MGGINSAHFYSFYPNQLLFYCFIPIRGDENYENGMGIVSCKRICLCIDYEYYDEEQGKLFWLEIRILL